MSCLLRLSIVTSLVVGVAGAGREKKLDPSREAVAKRVDVLRHVIVVGGRRPVLAQQRVQFAQGSRQRRKRTMTVSRNWRLTFGWDGEEAVDLDLEDYHG